MKITTLFILFIFTTSELNAGDLRNLANKARDAIKDGSEKFQAWGDHIENRNAKDIEEIEARFKKIWDNIEATVDKAVSDVEAEAKRVTKTLEADWKAYKDRRKNEPVAAKLPALAEADKKIAGSRVYKKVMTDTSSGVLPNEKLENFVNSFERAMFQESLNIEDAAYVVDVDGGTLLHRLVERSYTLEKASLRTKQLAQLGGEQAPSLEADDSYQQTLLKIAYLAETTKLGAVKNNAGKISLDIVLEGTPISVNLARYLVVHDLSNASKKRMEELFPSK